MRKRKSLNRMEGVQDIQEKNPVIAKSLNPVKDHGRPGYKHTPLGWIPEEWEVKELRSIGDFRGGGTPDTSNPKYWNGKIPWVSPKDMKADEISETEDYITDEAVKNSSANLIIENSILIVTRSGILRNRVPIAINRKVVSINQDLKAFKLKKHGCTDFIFQFLKYNNNSLLFQTAKVGTTVESLDFEALKNYLVSFPPVQEQREIAAILSTWDEAITKTQQLITQLQQRNKGLMQQLLMGKKRLKGFEGEWKMAQLGSLGESYNGLTGKAKEDFGSGRKFINYLTIFNNSLIKSTEGFGQVRINEGESQNEVKYGDIFFTVSSETPEEVGMSSVLLTKTSLCYLNSFCFGFRLYNFNTLSPVFAAFILRSEIVRKEIIKLAQGSTRFNLSKAGIKKLVLNLPGIVEQESIAEACTLLNNEVSLLEQKLAVLQQQKKGLMQKLLTGEVRVKVSEQDSGI